MTEPISPATGSPDPRLGPLALGAYAVGSIGNGVFSTVPTILLLYFCTETLGVPAALAALILLVPKAWSVVWDPLVGLWSDRTVSRLGRRRPFMIAGALGMPAAFLALFAPPDLGPTALVLWVGAAYFALATAYSLFAVPYSALPAELGADEAARAGLTATRMVLVMIGILAGAAGAPLIVAAFGGGRPGYAAMAVMIALGAAVAMTGPILMLRGRDRSATRRAAGHARPDRDILATFASPGFRDLAAAFLLQITAVGVVSAAAPYLIAGTFGRPDGDTGIAMGVLVIGATIATPAWSLLGRRLGDHRALVVATIVYGLVGALIGAAALARAPWPLALAVFGLGGAAFAGLQVLPFTLAAHVAHAESRRPGRPAEGTFTGVWTATEKLGLALGPALTGIMMAVFGREGSTIAAIVAFTPLTLVLAAFHLLRRRGAAPTRLIAGAPGLD